MPASRWTAPKTSEDAPPKIDLQMAESYAMVWRDLLAFGLGPLGLQENEVKALALSTFQAADRLPAYARFVNSFLAGGGVLNAALCPVAIVGSRVTAIRALQAMQAGNETLMAQMTDWNGRFVSALDAQAQQWDDIAPKSKIKASPTEQAAKAAARAAADAVDTGATYPGGGHNGVGQNVPASEIIDAPPVGHRSRQ